MTHEERIEIAREVASRILEKYGERVFAIAIYGSVAKGEDREHSDLDMWVATDEPVEDVRFFVYKGIPVSVNWDTAEGRIKAASRVTPAWPIDADELRSYLVLFERGDFVSQLREATNNLREEEFKIATRLSMVRLQETMGKLRNAFEAGDHYRLLVNGRWLVWGVAMTLGLLNRRYYPGGRGFYQLSKEMLRQPRDYAHLLDSAGGFETVDPLLVYGSATDLWDNLCELVRERDIEWESDEIPI
jgi:kanamycin nucleotidyltransferase